MNIQSRFVLLYKGVPAATSNVRNVLKTLAYDKAKTMGWELAKIEIVDRLQTKGVTQ